MTALAYLLEESTNPFHNLAVERFLLENVPTGTCWLYLWQNKHTVVIGRNQNCWAECKTAALERDGGHLVRRLSGGGAVYHDDGNLNFTFLANKADYDLPRQLSVIVRALQSLGFTAAISGRNDIEVDGRKVSGNAFYTHGNKKYHHGTILVNVQAANMQKYLTVSTAKLAAKGVASVQARIINLKDLQPQLTLTELKASLLNAFAEVYQATPAQLTEACLDATTIKSYTDEFASDSWRFGRRLPFTWETCHRFDWGEIRLQCTVDEGKIKEAELYSDAMEWEAFADAGKLFSGCAFSSTAMAAAAARLSDEHLGAELSAYLLSLDI